MSPSDAKQGISPGKPTGELSPVARSALEAQAARNWWKRLSDWLWGYDFFISYHWASGGVYAVNLAQMLRSRGFDVFLDRADYASGDDWKRIGQIALRNTQRLVLVATREAVTISQPVQHEVEIFTARNRQIIPIIFSDRFVDLQRNHYPTLLRLPDSHLFIDSGAESLAKGPTAETLEELIRTHQVLRRRSLRSIMVLSAFCLLSIAVIITAWQRREAVASRDRLGSQLASADFGGAHEESQPGHDLRMALLHALRSATVAPRSDHRRETYIDRVMFLAVQLPNRIVNLEGMNREPVRGVISPDLRWLATITTGFGVEAWELQSGRRLSIPFTGTIAGFTGDNAAGDDRMRGVMSLAISNDSRLGLVLMNKDFRHERLCVWELQSGRLLTEKLVESDESEFAFREDSRAVLRSTVPDASEAIPSTSRSLWQTVWTADDRESDASQKNVVANSQKRRVVLYQGTRPLDIVTELVDSAEGTTTISKDSNGVRPENWLTARKSEDGQVLACVSSSGYTAFWEKRPNPFVQQVAKQGHIAGAITSDGQSFRIDQTGILTRSDVKQVHVPARIRGGELSLIEDAAMRLSADGKHVLLWYRGIGLKGEADVLGGFELRDAASLQLLYERRSAPAGPDDWIKDIAWVGKDSDEIVFAQGNADSDYITIHRKSIRAEQWDTNRHGRPLGIHEFAALTLDGEYAIISRDSQVEVELVPTSGAAEATLGPFRFPGGRGAEKSMAFLLRAAYNLKQVDGRVIGKLAPNADLMLIDDSTGAQLFVNGLRVTGVAGIRPAAMSPSGLRWLGFGPVSSSGGVFGLDRVMHLIDSTTGYTLGEFPVPLTEHDAVNFISGDSTVLGYCRFGEVRIKTGSQLRSPPTWFVKMGAAVTGMELDANNTVRSLTPSEHQRLRQEFLQELKRASEAKDTMAMRLFKYFGDIEGETHEPPAKGAGISK